MKKIKFAEVKCDHRDDEGKYHIDCFKTEDDNEEGVVVATVDAEGEVDWKDHPAKFGDEVSEAIREAKDKQAEIKQVIIDSCLERIKEDVAVGDLTAIDELLKFIPVQYLTGFLSED